MAYQLGENMKKLFCCIIIFFISTTSVNAVDKKLTYMFNSLPMFTITENGDLFVNDKPISSCTPEEIISCMQLCIKSLQLRDNASRFICEIGLCKFILNTYKKDNKIHNENKTIK